MANTNTTYEETARHECFTMDSGYDYADTAHSEGYRALSAWGAGGWDLGDWPYVMVYIAPATNSVRYVVEGDITQTDHPTRADMIARIDELAHWHWRHDPARYGSDMVEAVAAHPSGAMPDRFCGPYSRDRK